ncbi:MAG: hypothetical protein KDD43_10600, partial [Bdellovibrionales bacterium]|nr:hypothetical protein [Bdellovibrionales bacterium]
MVDSVQVYGPENFGQSLLIAYQPDPFYPLDKRIAQAVAQDFAAREYRVIVATHGSEKFPNPENFDVVLLVANTYNWRPDWATTGWIHKSNLKGKKVVGLTLGAGSTEWSQQALENAIRDSGAELVASKSLWLLKPNDESRMDEKNSQVAVDLAVRL